MRLLSGAAQHNTAVREASHHAEQSLGTPRAAAARHGGGRRPQHAPAGSPADPTSQRSSAGGEDGGGGRGGDVGSIVPPSDRQLWCGSNRPVNRLAQRASNRAAAALTPGQQPRSRRDSADHHTVPGPQSGGGAGGQNDG